MLLSVVESEADKVMLEDREPGVVDPETDSTDIVSNDEQSGLVKGLGHFFLSPLLAKWR